jgi:hypothetical protein
MYSSKLKARSVSLTKLNPYFNKIGYHLPYNYEDPTFRKTCKGLFLKKDIYLQELIQKKLSNLPQVKMKRPKKHYYIDSNNTAYPKEIILNTVFPLKKRRNNNIANKFFEMEERKLFESNPYIIKYGSFSFGKDILRKKITLSIDLKNENITKIPFNKNINDIIKNVNIDKSYTERLNKKTKKRIEVRKHIPTMNEILNNNNDNFIGSFFTKRNLTDKK